MPRTRPRPADALLPGLTSGLAVLALLGGAALSGCSVSRDDTPSSSGGTSTSSEPSPSEAPSPSPTPTPTATPTATASATPTATATPSATPTPATTPAAALLSAAELPQLNPTSRWTQRRSGDAGTRPFGLCQKFDLLSIGALTAVERTFASGQDTAGQQVAEFPDAQNTARAAKVVQAWHDDCRSRVRGSDVQVRPFQDVTVAAGRGSHYLVSYEVGGEGHFHALGLVVSGTRLTLLKMDHTGQDHNYGPGRDPMELAVKAAATKLG